MKASFVVTVEHYGNFPYHEEDDTDWEDMCSEQIRDVEWNLINKAVDLFDRLLDESGIEYTEYDIDTECEEAYVCFINQYDKNNVVKLMNRLQSELERMKLDEEIEVYGRQISGGYPSYDPPEYEEFSVDVEVWFSCGNELYFEEE